MSSKRKQVTLAVVGSVGIHLAVLFAWAIAVDWFPAAQAASNQPPEELKLQVVEEPAATPPPPEPESPLKEVAPKLVFKDTDGLPEATKAPKNASFQSDRNAEAASEMPPTGDEPLPTQKGRAIPSFAFNTHPSRPGDAGDPTGPTQPPPLRDTAPPLPRPVATPLARSTPPPAPAVAPAADPRDLAMVTPNSIPANPVDAEPNPYDPAFRPPAGMTEPPRPTPVPRRGGYLSQQTRANTAGGIAQLGGDSVASAATPTGLYMASVVKTIDRRWRQLFDARADVVSLGTVRVHFAVDRYGKVRSTRVVSNTANEALASISLRAVVEASVPSMSDDVAGEIGAGLLPMDIQFNAEAPAF